MIWVSPSLVVERNNKDLTLPTTQCEIYLELYIISDKQRIWDQKPWIC